MRLRTYLGATALLCLPAVAAAQAQPPTGPPTAAPAPSPVGACTIVGQVLGPSDFGVAAGLPVADTTAIRLADGRIRLYTFAQGRGIVSAVSTAADGLAFIAEPGNRLPDGSGMPRIVALADGRVRLFFTSADGIKSAISNDGLTFVEEAGFRITKEQAGFIGTNGALRATSGATVVTLPDGRFRMYFSSLPRPGEPAGGHAVKSALSNDQLTWVMEAGVRLGPGAAVHAMTESAEHPFALTNGDGTTTLYYGKYGNTGSANAEGVYQSTSADGLTFTTETFDVFFGNDPDAIRRADGTLVLYFGKFDRAVGGTINVATCPSPGGSQRTVAIVGTFGPQAFSPNPSPGSTGDRVVFRNDDGTVHRLVFDDGSGADTGMLAPGQSSTAIALTSGSVTYRCTLHPSMTGTIGTTSGGSTTGSPTSPATPAPSTDMPAPAYPDYGAYRLKRIP